MEMYLLKSAACLGILYLCYKTVLENTSLHTTKRFYLLGSLIVSLLIPFITFTEYVIVTSSLATEAFTQVSLVTEASTPDSAPVNYIPYLLAAVYGLGVLILSIRFGRNMFRLFNKVRSNTKLKTHSIFHVLLRLPITPHSFFNYIFFSKNAYDAGEIPEEVIIHETAHVEQKHSWDIVFIELLRIVFWFNPLLHFIKHSIKLNHEFLADRTVLNRGADTSKYQTILLDFSSTSSVPSMAHSINYSSSSLNKLFTKNSFGLVKKRFTVMKTHTSKRAAWLRILVILPVLAVLIFGFSSTKTIEKTSSTHTPISNNAIPTARSIDIQIEADGTYIVEGISATKSTLAETVARLHQDLTPAIRNHMMNIHITRPKEPSREEVQFVYDALIDYGFYRLVAGNQEVVRGKGNTPMASESVATIKNKPFVIMVQVSEISINGKASSLKTFAKDIDRLTKSWEETDYTSNLPQVYIASTPDSFLNKLDAEFKKTHFSKANEGMSLIPPKPPKSGIPGDAMPPPPPPPPPPPAPVVYDGVPVTGSNTPPPPPPPVSPLDHIIKMAKKDATFYYEGKQISSDKAIQLLKKNKNLNIETIDHLSKNPTVKISTKGYTHKKKAPKNVALESGTEVINGQEVFYTKIKNKTTYFYNTGAIKNQAGQSLSKKEAPSFYLDGAKISPFKAVKILKTNSKYAVSVVEKANNAHKIMLDNVYKVNNQNSGNHYVSNRNNANTNVNSNPNSVIDLTEVIAEGATFYLNDKKITTEKAKYLAEQTDKVARVNVKKSKTENPKVYFWTK